MGKMSRQKGATGERDFAAALRAVFPDCSRRASGEEAQGRQGVDLKGTPGFVFQCQCAGTLTPLAKLREAEKAAEPHEIPVALLRLSSRSRSSEPFAAIYLRDLLLLLAAYESERKGGGPEA
jgi:hypothetical protein